MTTISTQREFRFPRTKAITLIAMFTAVLSILSLVSIPIGPVPITLQVFAVLLIAALLGPYYGALTCLLYLLIGAIGVPVFAGETSGIPVLFGPTGGYLFAFPLAAFLGGLACKTKAASMKWDLIRIAVCMVVSIAVIYVIGVLWLTEYLHLSLYQGILFGALPFIPVDLVKAVVAASISWQLRWRGIMLPTTTNPDKMRTTAPA